MNSAEWRQSPRYRRIVLREELRRKKLNGFHLKRIFREFWQGILLWIVVCALLHLLGV